MNEQERLLRQLSAYKFSSWELHIFLDTHPGNCEAARKKAEVDQRIEELTQQYEAKYGPLMESSQNSRWAWISGPWPWENGTEEDN
ncbi:MAG TPA: spore coat protein CotJB [Candidatus Gallacutalibacter pullicola]|uniref:Spore coat protein CotJB n=1 Tax=Candidatus Gallacutalibacter pullicola TaxID=2840830 RepID=A0A9D1J1R2_9FIRM|nr:spore coat protein CotJB [Candidatus Gallacutalibacter pullicola]